VGIGGAILIGALAAVAWRIYGKKKSAYDDDIYDPNAKQRESGLADHQTPFQSTLDQYHGPTQVNTSSNF